MTLYLFRVDPNFEFRGCFSCSCRWLFCVLSTAKWVSEWGRESLGGSASKEFIIQRHPVSVPGVDVVMKWKMMMVYCGLVDLMKMMMMMMWICKVVVVIYCARERIYCKQRRHSMWASPGSGPVLSKVDSIQQQFRGIWRGQGKDDIVKCWAGMNVCEEFMLLLKLSLLIRVRRAALLAWTKQNRAEEAELLLVSEAGMKMPCTEWEQVTVADGWNLQY